MQLGVEIVHGVPGVLPTAVDSKSSHTVAPWQPAAEAPPDDGPSRESPGGAASFPAASGGSVPHAARLQIESTRVRFTVRGYTDGPRQGSRERDPM